MQFGRLHVEPAALEAGFGDWNPIPASKIDAYYATEAYFMEWGALLRDPSKLAGITRALLEAVAKFEPRER